MPPRTRLPPDASLLAHIVAALAPTHRVLVPDWFGWGDSERRVSDEPSYERESRRIGLLLDTFHLGAANLSCRDTYSPLAIGRELARLVPDAALTIVPGADHYVLEQRPAPVVAALRELLARHRAP